MRPHLILLLTLLCLMPARAGEGTLTAGRDGSAARLNLNVVFDYNETDLEGWKTHFQTASEFLYDYTERQVQLGRVTFFVNQPAQRDRADVLILRGQDKASASYPTLEGNRTLGRRGPRVNLGQLLRDRKRVPGETSAGPAVTGHELGHYVFGLADEYRGVNTTRVYTAGAAGFKRDPGFDFCTQSDNRGIACVMEDSGDTELCTALSDPVFRHNMGYFLLPLPAADSDGQIRGRFYQNDQEVENKADCWSFLVKLSKLAYGIEFQAPIQAPVASIEGHQPVEFVVVSAGPDAGQRSRSLAAGLRLVLLIDSSDDSPGLAALIGAAQIIVEALPGSQIALVDVDATPALEVAFTSDLAQVQRALLSLRPSTVSGRDLAGALALARGQIEALPQRTGGELVLFLTSGPASTTDPTGELERLAALNVPVFAQGLGTKVSFDSLEQAAELTGGLAGLAETDGELAADLTTMIALAGGSLPVAQSQGQLQAATPEASLVVPIDAHSSGLQLSLAWSGATPELSLVDPQGQTVIPQLVVTDANYRLFAVDSARPGNWTIRLRSDAPTNYALDVLLTDSTLYLTDLTESSRVTYPALAPLHAGLQLGDDAVLGAEVQGRVVRPDGSTAAVTLYDDGQPSHADRVAGDGIYSNFFGSFTGDGVYQVSLVAGGSAAQAVPFDPGRGPVTPTPVGPFQRTLDVEFAVAGVPTNPGPADLRIDSLPPPDDLSFVGTRLDLPVANFRLTAGGQGVLVDSLDVSLLGTTPADQVQAVKLYPFNPQGPELGSLLARGQYSPQSGRFQLFEPIRLAPGEARDLTLALDLGSTPGVPIAGLALDFGPGPLLCLTLLVLLAWMLSQQPRTRWALASLALLSLLWLGQGCSTSNAPVSGQGGARVSTLSVRVAASDLKARTELTGQSVSAQGTSVPSASLTLLP